MDPKGKIALVTGGASGIGLDVAKQLLRQGVKGLSICDINTTKGETEVKQMQQEFGKNTTMFIKTDVTKQDETEAAFQKTVKEFGGLDIVINNAGLINDNKWEYCVSVNVNGIIRTALLALKYMGKERGGNGGVVVNTGSVAGLAGGLQITAIYSATKSAIIGLSRSLGCDYILETTGVRVLCICPGYTETELVSSPSQEPVTVTALEDWMSEFNREMAAHPQPQRVENVSKAVLHMIREGKNGSLWVSESDETPYEIVIPPHGIDPEKNESSSARIGRHTSHITKGYKFVPGLGYYKLYENSTRLTWKDAVEICKKDDSHLLILNSELEAKTISSMIVKTSEASSGHWVGLHDGYKKGNYITIFNETLQSTGYSDWYTGYPSSQKQSCLWFYYNTSTKNYGHVDGDCNNKQPFFCEFDVL